ncbi:trimethylamine methyltransferase family protein [Coralliovum pocilloporae]|uniref:trimethylamine methyltransferase family protein n=1 Tax=Coralliovum pocilloporae TaxID=3066369 RepID=UPI003307727B
MSRRRARSGPRSRAQTPEKLPQLPWQSVQNPYQPLDILSDDQLEAIHQNSLRILQELGIEVMSADALELFREAGAEIDDATMTVRLAPEIVEQALSTVPSHFTLTPRNPDRQITLGGNHLTFGLVAGPPSVHDCINGRRSGNLQDYENFIRLAHHFNAVHMIGNQVVAPVELPAPSRHLDTYNANITYSDLSYHCTAIGRERAVDGITMMAISRGMTPEQMMDDPGVMTIISVNSPRKFDDAMSDGLIAMAEYGQAVSVTPFTLMGAMTPVTLAAALSQQNAEALFGITLAQLVRPGTPVMYGAFTSNVDMRSGAPAFGTPENAKANAASGQLARKYGIPYRTSNANASNCADAQAVYETQMALWGAVLGHANIVYHGAGWLEGGLTASYEKFILDVEMIQNMIEFLKPLDTSADELAFDAIRNVPTGGHFFGEAHTMERYETAFYRPLVSDWQNHENWEAAGSKTATDRATEIWQQALEEYEQPQMDASIREELDAYIARRREALSAKTF